MGYHPNIDELLPDDAFAIEAMRIVNGFPRTYTPKTAKDPSRARSFCYTMLNRCRAMGMLTEPGADDDYAIIDVLNANDDIVAEVCVNRKGFRYLARTLKWKWENRDEYEQQFA